MKLITIFTPTFNRKEQLKVLYASLCNQTNKDFIWLIVDDGSTDNTEELVSEWQKQNIIEIKYIKQKNGGKYKAVNTGVIECTTELFGFVDSDDYFLPDTVETFLNEWSAVKNKNRVAGIVGRRQTNKNKIVGKQFEFDKKITNENKLLKKYGYYGDTCRMYRTDILRKNLYPNIEEKFIPEHVMLSPINNKYDLLFLNRALSVSEYLEDGYTLQYKELLIKNKKGHLLGLNEEINVLKKGLLHSMKYTILYILWGKNQNLSSFKQCKNKLLYITLMPTALLLYWCDIPRWYNSNDKEKIIKKIKTKIQTFTAFLKSFKGTNANIMNTADTIDYILKEKKSVIRFGDGEFNFFRGYGVKYQKYRDEILNEFENIISQYDENSKFLLCVPKTFFEMNGFELLRNRQYFLCWSYARYCFNKKFKKDVLYGDAFIFAKQNKSLYAKLFNNAEIENVIFVHNNEKFAKELEHTYNKKVYFIKTPENDSFFENKEILKKIIYQYNNLEKVLVIISSRSKWENLGKRIKQYENMEY